MKCRERVIAALEYNYPDRIPRDIWALPYIKLFRKKEYEVLLRDFPPDIHTACAKADGPLGDLEKLRCVGSYADEWGCIWDISEPGVIGEVKRPIIDDFGKLSDFSPPYEVIEQRDLSHVDEFCRKTDKFVLSGVTAQPFERMQFLRGSQNLYTDILLEQEKFLDLLRMVHDYFLEDIKSWCRSAVDGIVFMDDWGSNNALLIDPELWRDLFKPLYKEYCNIIHDAGKYAFMHSDGYIIDIYEDLIEAGVDAINSQLFRMDIEELARKYKGRITFWGEIDRQQILPFGTPTDVETAVRRIRQAMDDGRGGLIAQCEWGKDNKADNIRKVYQSWL